MRRWKAAKPAAAPKKAGEVEDMHQPDYTKLDIRVGQIVSAAPHPKPDVTSLNVEQIVCRRHVKSYRVW
jgi:tRNA-binding EMAP/Myf-like protein